MHKSKNNMKRNLQYLLKFKEKYGQLFTALRDWKKEENLVFLPTLLLTMKIAKKNF